MSDRPPPSPPAGAPPDESSLSGLTHLRVEDDALLRGTARFGAELPVARNCAHAAILRSPYPHATIESIDPTRAVSMPGVYGVLTRDDIKAWSRPFLVGVREPMEHWSLAVERVRYVGEPIAVVLAADRYLAEDALDGIDVDLEPLPAVADPEAAACEDAPILHPDVGSNVVHEREFVYGDPDAAFAKADHRLEIDVKFPRNVCTPIETFVVDADFDRDEQCYTVRSNFQGPFSLHAVMARALNVSGAKLRLQSTPHSGGSFGVKQAVFPYVVLMALASRKIGRPVRWIEDRLEHLSAATSATARATRVAAAFNRDGRIIGLRYDQLDDCGAYLRAPEPATLYRMHGNFSGAYAIEHIAVRNRVVLSNRTPSGLNRGFGGPQLYHALETLVRRIGSVVGLEHATVAARNVVPASAFPYRTASGALLDSGDYGSAIRTAIDTGGYADLLAFRDTARREGRLVGIGSACIVEPSVSNMGYITTLLTPEQRERAGPKNGAIATATVNVEPSGSVSVGAASIPQGQGHRTVLATVVADVLGLAPSAVVVNLEHDTQKDAWSIASGNYSSRFAGAVAGVAYQAACRIRDRLAVVAAAQLNVEPAQVEFADGRVFATDNHDNAVPFARVAGLFHWSPGELPDSLMPALRETAFWTPESLTPPDRADRINSSGAYGFVFDYCALEVDRDTAQVRIHKYVTMHDAGRLLHRGMADGQIRGGFAQGVGAALLEELAYDAEGNFLSGTLADYRIPTACEVPEPVILHAESPSPFTPLGAKGLGEGNSMSTPVCIANALADALDVDNVDLPATPERLAPIVFAKAPSAGEGS